MASRIFFIPAPPPRPQIYSPSFFGRNTLFLYDLIDLFCLRTSWAFPMKQVSVAGMFFFDLAFPPGRFVALR